MRIYFTSDIHASERCWRKFLATPKHYGVDVIIVGGDITGKSIVSVVGGNGAWRARFAGEDWHLSGEDEVLAFERRVADTGAYTWRVDEAGEQELAADPSRVERLFRQLVLERIERWVALADERLAGSGVRCLVSGGNDDFFEVDDALRASSVIEVPEDRVVDLDGHELIGLGYANPTPWDCPRDLPEPDLGEKLERLASQVRDMDRAIFDVHVPPYGCGLDLAPQLDAELRLVMSASGERQMIPVGSTAVRDAIERFQPLLGLHGHIHDSQGIKRLGRTTVINCGSEYQDGILDGALIDVNSKRGRLTAQLVAG
jgi:Icc-related predicted phosphoesterase